MKVLMLSIDSQIFKSGSFSRDRMRAYGGLVEELHIVCYTGRGFSEEKISDNIFLYPTNSRFRVLYFLDGWLITRRLRMTDAWVVDSQEAMTNVLGIFLKLFSRAKLHVQIHTDFMSDFFVRQSLKNKLRYIGYRLGLYYADAVRVVSERIRRSIAVSNETPIVVLPIFTVTKKEENGGGVRLTEEHSEVDFKVLAVSRLEPEKDLATALEAFSEFHAAMPQSGFFISGDGTERKRLEFLAKALHIQDSVVFLGWQKNVSVLYDEADVYMLTSLYEGYSQSLVEAAAFGCPIVSTDVGIIGDVFVANQSALVAPPGDSVKLAEHLKSIAQNKGLGLRLAAEAYRAQQRHRQTSWEQYLELYKRSWEQCFV